MTISSAVERLTGLHWREQGPVCLVGLGHGGIHWIAGSFYLLLPFITEDLGLSYSKAGLLVAFLLGASTVANLGSGPVVDLTGRRVLIQVVALLVGAVALFAFAASDRFLVLIVLVSLIGASNNLWHPAAISYLSQRYPANRGYALSIHTLGANAGEAGAPLVAGIILLWWSWQATAAVSALPAIAIAILIAVTLMPRDVPGARKERHSMGGAEYLRGLLELFRNKTIIGICMMSGFRAVMQNGLFMFLPLYLADVLGFGPLWLGAALSALQVGGVIGGPVAGAMSDRVGRKPVLVAALLATTVGVVVLTFTGSGILFVATVFLLGVFAFAARPVAHSWLMDASPPHLGGSATSLMFGAQSGMSILAPAIGGIVADTWGLVTVFYVLGAATLISAALAFLLPSSSHDNVG